MPSLNTFVLEVSWNGDNDFGDTGEDITAYVFDCQTTRGRNYASQLTGRSVAGRLQATLDNRDGRFSSFLSTGPLFGNILPGRKVRLRSTAPTAATMWAGYLDRIEPRAGALPTAILYASGPLVKLGGPNAKVNPLAKAEITTGEAIEAILDAYGWPGGDRQIDAGDVEIRSWYKENAEALAAMQEIEETEQGFLAEGLAWDVVFEARYNRFLNHLTSVATFSDDPAASLPYLVDIVQDDPLREIFNEFVATVQPYLEGDDVEVLWTLTESVVLDAGESRTFTAVAPSSAAFVLPWTTPPIAEDITQTGVSDGDIDIAVNKNALSMEITITNNHVSAAATLTLVQARGKPWTRRDPFKVLVQDATSQTSYGKRTYPLSSPWYGNSAFAEGTGQYLIARHKDPRPILTLTIPAAVLDTLFAQAVQRDLSDRITVVASDIMTKMGINNDFYIEAIAHRWGARTPLETTFHLSPAEADPGWWILDVSDDLDTDTILAY